MKIAVFGTGIVGQVIASRLAGLGHQITIGTRDPQKTLQRTEKDSMGNPPFKDWYSTKNQQVKLGTFQQAAAGSDMIFNCTHGVASIEALKLAALTDTDRQVLVDISNPLDFSKGFPPSLSVVNTDSLGEMIQRAFPQLKVVKTLNTMTCFVMVNPASVPGDHNVFVSGNDAEAKVGVVEVLKSFGWKKQNIIDLGDITTARGTEQLLPIWVRLMGAIKTPMFNFNIVKAPQHA